MPLANAPAAPRGGGRDAQAGADLGRARGGRRLGSGAGHGGPGRARP